MSVAAAILNDKVVILYQRSSSPGGEAGVTRVEGGVVATLSSQFREALAAIEPSVNDRENAPKAHEAVRAALTAADELKEWGLNPVLIGSYKRHVSIRRVKDVDVFCRMENIGADIAATTVLDNFFRILDAEYGTDTEGNPRVKRLFGFQSALTRFAS